MMGLGAVARRARAAGGVDVHALDALCDQTRRTLVEAREAVVAMRTSTDALRPLAARLEETARRILEGTGVGAHVVSSGTPRPLPPEVDEQVVRVASEAITNARTHAACRAVEVTCAFGDHALTVRVRDDGRGFDPAAVETNGHYGLVGMRERAASIGATLAVTSAPGDGTEVVLVVSTAAGEWAQPGRAAALQER
jgi:signal transduction histidine kinase